MLSLLLRSNHLYFIMYFKAKDVKMKRNLLLILLVYGGFSLSAQSLADEVYVILQSNCTTSGCHNSTDAAANLDLQGSGANASLQVYNNLVNVSPSNEFARNKGYDLVHPGRPDKSFLFRKINQGLEAMIDLDAEEKKDMPINADPLSDIEKEKIRQWILYGAQLNGTPTVNGVTVSSIVEDYYTNGGGEAFPDGPPPAPAASEGFQIKMGPFFLPPKGEVEYFQKYDLDLPEKVEVNRIDMTMSNYSHHLILYDFNPGGSSVISPGYRLEPDHSDIGLVTAIQQPEDLRLPEGTAFKWEESIVLDLNSHYINYDAASPYKSESYINIYTQEDGTAAQEMKTELLANFNIWIPNDGDMRTFRQNVNFNLGDIYLWGLMGHTHKYGRGYKVYERINGQEGDLIYDASCAQGEPGCVSPSFDYQHIPFKRYDSFRPLKMNFSNGIIHEASYVNDGPLSVGFGATSDEEMMVLVLMYVDDLDGVTVSNDQVRHPVKGVKFYPNPMSDFGMISLPKNFNANSLSIYDLTGKEVRRTKVSGEYIEIERSNLQKGMYVYRLEDAEGQFATGKIVIE